MIAYRKPYPFVPVAQAGMSAPTISDYELVANGHKLTRADKDRIFAKLQGNTGRAYYHMSGWEYPFATYMDTFLVKYAHQGWLEIKAFDKMCIRNNMYTNKGIMRIINITKIKKE